MISVCENIKKEAIEVFDNFITQVILPSEDEIKGIQEHNRSVREAFDFSFIIMLLTFENFNFESFAFMLLLLVGYRSCV